MPSKDDLEEQAAKLQSALLALSSLSKPPQERIDRALGWFVRTFRDEPPGEAGEHYRRIYAILGNPPVGTTITCKLDTLSADELEELPTALCKLAELVATEAARAVG